MAKLDTKLTEQIQVWLNSEHSADDMICQGALLLLRLNGNRALYANILRRPSNPRWKARLEIELGKHLKIRLDGLTRQEVAEMDARVVKEAEVILDTADKIQTKGKRKDHDKLPEAVQQLFESCGSIYKKIRTLHTMLRSMNDMRSCDRYEYLKQMDELDDMYRRRMREYDEYQARATAATSAIPEGEELKAAINKERSYIKRLQSRLRKAYDSRFDSQRAMQAYEDMLAEAMPHIYEVLRLGGAFTEKVRQPLRECGIKFPDGQDA